MTSPLWLGAAGVQHLLNHIVDKLDAAEAQGKELGRSIKLDARSFPGLFKASYEEEREQQWAHLEEMASWGWFGLRLNRQHPGQARYECNPRIVVLDELAIRTATGRPERVRSGIELWRDAVFAGLIAPEATKELVSRYRIEIPGRTPTEVVTQLQQLGTLADEPLLLREVSARLFWGQSKVLDGRQALVSALLGADCPFPEMPVQLQVFLPAAGFDGVLFIENQATFEQATRDSAGRFARLALVYASGFKGSARRLRSPAGTSVYFAAHGAIDEPKTKQFLGWLRNGVGLPSWFWGDLDYSGMQILASLRGVFDSLEAWEPGYAPMLEHLQQGYGHTPEAAGKSGQLQVVVTGCSFADTELLPALNAHGRFVDQELA